VAPAIAVERHLGKDWAAHHH
jgi:hypothetical protein